jgi:protein SCO1/2
MSFRASLVALSLFAFIACRRQPELPRLFPVPATTLTNEAGKPVNLDTNKGFVTVYNFIFTNCAGTCPIMSHNMRSLTKQVPKDAKVRFVSISVDPARDTPAVLADYARKVRNDPRWMFLTGEPKQIVELSVKGFKLAAGTEPQPGSEALLHSSKFAVADQSGMIRVYHDATDGEVVKQTAATIEELLAE